MPIDYVVGYLPIYLSDKFGTTFKVLFIIFTIRSHFKLKQLENPLMVGGGKSINGKLMMKFQTKLPVYLMASVDLSNATGGVSPKESFLSDKTTRRTI